MKLLYILNVANRVNNFSYTSMIAAKELGHEFHIAGNWSYKSQEEKDADEKKYGIYIHQIDFERNPLSSKNFKAYKQLKQLFDRYNFDAVHCNTPIGGLLGRIVANKNKVSPVIYQAHGFHFYKGAPLLNWLLYFPLEWFCSFFTDVLITINEEDFEFSQKHMKAKNIQYVHGIGVDITRFCNEVYDKNSKRKEIGVPESAVMMLSVGELNKNKNHEVILRAMAKIENKNIHYCIAGNGNKNEYLLMLAKSLNLSDRFHLLGYRKDINELLACSDIFCFPSFREGLPVSLMEAMAAGLPVVCSEIRGNTDLVQNGEGGFLCKADNSVEFAEKIDALIKNNELRKNMKAINLENIKKFDTVYVTKEMKMIYKEILNEKC